MKQKVAMTFISQNSWPGMFGPSLFVYYLEMRVIKELTLITYKVESIVKRNKTVNNDWSALL